MTTATATKPASAEEVRAWAQKKSIPVGSRGRFSADLIEAFNKAHRVKAYTEPSAS